MGKNKTDVTWDRSSTGFFNLKHCFLSFPEFSWDAMNEPIQCGILRAHGLYEAAEFRKTEGGCFMEWPL